MPLTYVAACKLCVARAQGHGMGLHASAHRLRRLAAMERFLTGQRRRLEREQGQEFCGLGSIKWKEEEAQTQRRIEPKCFHIPHLDKGPQRASGLGGGKRRCVQNS